MFSAKKYFAVLCLMIAVLAAVGTLALGQRFFCWWLSIPAYFLALGIASGIWMAKTRDINPKTFTSIHLAGSTFKILASVAALFAYLYFVNEERTLYLVSFLVFYVVFSIFETVASLKSIRK